MSRMVYNVTKETQKPKHLMIFDLEVTGHYPGYIRHLVRYWSRKCDDLTNREIKISFVVSPEFLTRHADIVNLKKATNIEWVAATEDEHHWYHTSASNPVARARAEWVLLCRYARKLGATQVLMMYIDHLQLPLALQLPLPCELSGIYFRPSFHYKHFSVFRPSFKDRLRILRQSFLWRLAFHHPRLKILFSLDPFAVVSLQDVSKTNVVHLPDPVEDYQRQPDPFAIRQLRTELGIEDGRIVFLLFGILGERKGMYQLLNAIRYLSPSLIKRISLLFVGPLVQVEEQQINAKIASISAEEPIQIISRDRFVKDPDIQPYFNLADVVLAPYQSHVGMSAVLVRAAVAGKPVLASNYGLIGEVVRQYSLGLTLDSTQAGEIAKGISAFLDGSASEMFDPSCSALFACENSAERFASVLWERLNVE
ncbi:MAG: glycosyltransferase [Chloroflexota bacterium]